MKVIGAGFGRTGTVSLRAALNTVGFGPCYHMSEVYEHPEHEATWTDALSGRTTDWRAFLDGYQSTMDWPGCIFWKELCDTFPDAQIVLNTRDPERWYDSVWNTIAQSHPDHPEHDQLPTEPAGLAAMVNVAGQSLARQFGTFERLADPVQALEVFRAHYEEVQATIPAARLLVYEVKQGWGPLCEFLGVPVPDQPFPHLNDRDTFGQVAAGDVQTMADHRG